MLVHTDDNNPPEWIVYAVDPAGHSANFTVQVSDMSPNIGGGRSPESPPGRIYQPRQRVAESLGR